MDTLEQTIVELIAKEGRIPIETIHSDSRLSDLKIDSLDVVQIIFELEDRFDISLPDRDPTVDTESVAGLVAAVKRLIAERADAQPASDQPQQG